jgi:hypothetical protein
MTQTQQQPGKPIEPTPAAGQPAGAPRKAGPARVAAVAVRAGQAFVLSLRLGRAGEPPVVVESSQVLAASVLADRQALAKLVPAGVDVVGVIPASAAAVRTVRAELPVDAPADALVGPLSLMAEAQYPSSPAHRRGAGRLVMSGDQAVPAYAVTTWTGSAGDVERLGNMAKAWVPEQVALSWLHRLSGSRGAGMSVIADRDSGWIVMAGIGREGVSLRTVRDDPEDHEAFAQTLSDAMEEAAEAIDAQVPASLASLNGVARSIRLSGGTSALAGIARDERPEWLANFGTCLGAGAAYLLSDPAEAGLVSMRLAPPRVGGQIVQRVLTVLGSPVVVIAAAGLLASAVLFGPLAAAAMRKSTLEQRAASMAGSQGQAQSVKDDQTDRRVGWDHSCGDHDRDHVLRTRQTGDHHRLRNRRRRRQRVAINYQWRTGLPGCPDTRTGDGIRAGAVHPSCGCRAAAAGTFRRCRDPPTGDRGRREECQLHGCTCRRRCCKERDGVRRWGRGKQRRSRWLVAGGELGRLASGRGG